MLKSWAAALAGAMLLVSCSSLPETAAVVDGVELSGARLADMSPTRDAEPLERVKDLNLLILHEIITTRAESEFGFVASEDQIADAFDERVRGQEDGLDEWLAVRGSTTERAMLESELDVIRSELETAMVESDEYGFDFEAAYRSFLGVNSRVCLRGLTISDPEMVDDVAARVDTGTNIDTLTTEFGGAVQELEIGCDIPVEHGPLLAPVAVDGEIGVSYMRETDGGTQYVVEVVERDAPAAEDVRDDVLALGVERQAPLLFDAWVVEQLRAADVEVDEAVGVWSTIGEDDIPTVAMAPGE